MSTRTAIALVISMFAAACSVAPSEAADQSEDEVNGGTGVARSQFAKSVVGDYAFLDTNPDEDDMVVYANLSLGADGRYSAARVGREGCVAASEEHDECTTPESGTWSAKASQKLVTLRSASGETTTYYVEVLAEQGEVFFEAQGTASGPGAGGTAFTLTKASRVLPQLIVDRTFGGSGPKSFAFAAPGAYSVRVPGEPGPVVIENGAYAIDFKGFDADRTRYQFGLSLTPSAASAEDYPARTYQATYHRGALVLNGSGESLSLTQQ